jgi:fumarate reductase subunit D
VRHKAKHFSGVETMTGTQTGLQAETEEAQASGVSWGAIIAGGVATSALTLMLLVFGVGMGFATVSPWSHAGISSTTRSVGAGLFLIVVAMLSSTIGGYLAGRLRTRWVGVHTHEVYFRDTAHGFLAWGLATVLSAAALASATANIVGAASTGLGQAAGPATAQSSSPIDPFVDRLFRPAAANQAGEDPTAPRAQIGRLLTASLRVGGDVALEDRTYMAQVVAQSTGLTQADAEKRVSEVVTQAKVTADNARKGAMKLSLWLTASMLIGAFAASLAATEGGMLRDRAGN